MLSINEQEFIQAYSALIGMKNEKASKHAEKYGLNALIMNPDMLFSEPEQKERFESLIEIMFTVPALEAREEDYSDPEVVSKIAFSRIKKMGYQESVLMLSLDEQRKLISADILTMGTLSHSIIHPRDAMRIAIANNADAVIFVHNHPSGIPDPSTADIKATEGLIEAGALLGIPVLDHVIIGDFGQYYSMKKDISHADKFESEKEKIKETLSNKDREFVQSYATLTGMDEQLVLRHAHKYGVNEMINNPNALLSAAEKKEKGEEMFSRHDREFMKAYATLVGIKEENVFNYAQMYSVKELVNNPDTLLTTQEQRELYGLLNHMLRTAPPRKIYEDAIAGPLDAAEYGFEHCTNAGGKEETIMLSLDTRLNIICVDTLHAGELTTTNIKADQAIRTAIVNNAESVIIIHSNPNIQNPSPKKAHVHAMSMIAVAGFVSGIRISDFIIVGSKGKHISLSQQGTLGELKDLIEKSSDRTEMLSKCAKMEMMQLAKKGNDHGRQK